MCMHIFIKKRTYDYVYFFKEIPTPKPQQMFWKRIQKNCKKPENLKSSVRLS